MAVQNYFSRAREKKKKAEAATTEKKRKGKKKKKNSLKNPEKKHLYTHPFAEKQGQQEKKIF